MIVIPSDTFAVFPKTKLQGLFYRVEVLAESVLFALVPPTVVLSSIGPTINAEALLFIKQELTLIADTIRVNEDTISRHVVVEPFSVALSTVFPKISAETLDFVVDPVSFISGSICPGVLAFAFLFTKNVVALV